NTNNRITPTITKSFLLIKVVIGLLTITINKLINEIATIILSMGNSQLNGLAHKRIAKPILFIVSLRLTTLCKLWFSINFYCLIENYDVNKTPKVIILYKKDYLIICIFFYVLHQISFLMLLNHSSLF